MRRVRMLLLLIGVTACGGDHRREVRTTTTVEVSRSASVRAVAASEPPAPVVAPAAIVRRDLGSLPPELAALAWPAPPAIEREAHAHDAASLQRAIDTGGTRVHVHGRIDGQVVAHASDLEILLADDARLERLVIDPGVHRVRVSGGSAGAIELLPPASWDDEGHARYDAALFVEDVTIDGVRLEASDSALVIRGRRVAILGNDVRAERYSLWAGDTGPLDGEDLIVAGNTMRSAGPESTLRLHDVVRSVVVDDVLENGDKHNYRVHGRSDLAFAARNTLIRTGMMLGTQPADAVGTIFFVDNVLYHDAPSLLEIEPRAIRRLVYRGNVAYTDRWDSSYPYPTVRDGWTVEGNRREPFRPYVAAPTASIGH